MTWFYRIVYIDKHVKTISIKYVFNGIWILSILLIITTTKNTIYAQYECELLFVFFLNKYICFLVSFTQEYDFSRELLIIVILFELNVDDEVRQQRFKNEQERTKTIKRDKRICELTK